MDPLINAFTASRILGLVFQLVGYLVAVHPARRPDHPPPGDAARSRRRCAA